jgi:hypothetical protein
MSTISFGVASSPRDEQCAQYGTTGYVERAKEECRVFKDMLNRLFPPPEGACLTVRALPYEDDPYYEVCVTCQDHHQEAVLYAMNLINCYPEEWDDIAREKLGLPLAETAEATIDSWMACPAL